MFDVGGERKTLVASKSPHLPRGGCNDGDGADHGQDDKDSGHDHGAAEGACGIVEHLDDGDTGGRIEDTVNIPNAKAKGDDHRQPEQSVEESCPDHGRWKDTSSILEFLGHVSACIWAKEAPERSRDPDEAGKPNIAPSSAICERAKDLTGRGMVAHRPQDNQEGEVPENVDDKEDAFRQRQFPCQEEIKDHGDDEENHDEERRLPEHGNIGIFVLQQDQALYQGGSQLGGGWATSNPSKKSEPSDNVAEWLFDAFWCKFRHPVICTTNISGKFLGRGGKQPRASREGSRGATAIAQRLLIHCFP